MGRQRIERQATTAAGAATVYALLRDGASWPAWSPLDSVVLERPGADEPEGVGAVRVLRSGRVTGRDEIAELVPDRRFAYRHRSRLPVRDYVGTVELEPAGAGTSIRWTSTFEPTIPGTGWLLRVVLGRFIGDLTDGLARHAGALAAPRPGA
jgi:polyketide cyclase/dehydrase/lipid transport protein